jgi:hypothetical protein
MRCEIEERRGVRISQAGTWEPAFAVKAAAAEADCGNALIFGIGFVLAHGLEIRRLQSRSPWEIPRVRRRGEGDSLQFDSKTLSAGYGIK